jgi:hypothetical protein
VTRPLRVSSRSSLLLLAAATTALVLAGGFALLTEEDSKLVGLIVDVRGQGDYVPSFTLRTADETYEIRIASEVEYAFPLSHLRAHERMFTPVRCKVEHRQGRLYALEIEDA